MAVNETFSKRQKRERGETPDVFIYDDIPLGLRVQIVHLWAEGLGSATDGQAYMTTINPAYKYLHQALAEEFGMFGFRVRPDQTDRDALVQFFVNMSDTSQALDIIELSFSSVLAFSAYGSWQSLFHVTSRPETVIDDLNKRFLEHGVGYAFVLGDFPRLIRKDNEHIHQEAVLPALQLLRDETFSGADAEYRNAHQHYRHGRYDECLTDCLKAFESTMKTISLRRGWDLPEKATASALVRLCLKKGLLGDFMEQHLGNFQAALESGIPTVRNKWGAHGDGERVREVPRFYAEYLLHETAVTIVLLVDAFKELPHFSSKA